MKPFTRYSRHLSKIMIFAMLCAMLLQPVAGWAKIYKYKDDQGKTHFTDDASAVPLKYRKQIEEKKYRGVTDSPGSSSAPGMGASPGKDSGADKGADKGKDEGLTEKDKALIHKVVPMLQAGVALANRYAKAQPNFSTGKRLVNDIQSALPKKKSLAKELAESKAPALKKVLGFLTKSIATDEQTKSVGAGLKKVIVGIINRVVAEGKTQAALILELETAWDEDAKKQKEKKKQEKSQGTQSGTKSGGAAPSDTKKKQKPPSGLTGM